jgi:SAM-dependent methyltransferase
MPKEKDISFVNSTGETINYKDVMSGKYKIKNKHDEMALAIAGGIGWEYGAFTSEHLGGHRRTHYSEYLHDPKKVTGSEEAFDFFEKRYGKLNENSAVIEFGCNLGRNLRVAQHRYGSKCVGIDINPYVIEENKKTFAERDEFYVENLRDGGEFLKKFKDNEFDLGITCGFLLHVAADDNKKKLIQEIKRVCKYLWFSEPNSAGLDMDSEKVDKTYNDGNGASTEECMSYYIKEIYLEKDAENQPGEQSLYFYP